MSELLTRRAEVVVSGTVEDQGRFYDQFEHVVLLSAPVEALMQREHHCYREPTIRLGRWVGALGNELAKGLLAEPGEPQGVHVRGDHV